MGEERTPIRPTKMGVTAQWKEGRYHEGKGLKIIWKIVIGSLIK